MGARTFSLSSSQKRRQQQSPPCIDTNSARICAHTSAQPARVMESGPLCVHTLEPRVHSLRWLQCKRQHEIKTATHNRPPPSLLTPSSSCLPPHRPNLHFCARERSARTHTRAHAAHTSFSIIIVYTPWNTRRNICTACTLCTRLVLGTDVVVVIGLERIISHKLVRTPGT